MAARSIATLSLSFGLVSIPVKLYSATESSSAIRFKLMGAGGARLRQQYVADEPAAVEDVAPPPPPTAPPEAPQRPQLRAVTAARADEPVARTAVVPPPADDGEFVAAPAVVERSDMVKGYEYEKGQFVVFTAGELKALQEASRPTVDIVAFAPERSVNPIYYDKAYFLAPDKRGGKPYSLLLKAMQATGQCAIAKWAWRAKEYVVQIRPAEGGMVLQQLLYADEVRSLRDLDIEIAEVSGAEIELAKRLIEQISVEAYDPTAYVDEEKQRILAAVAAKIEGKPAVDPVVPVAKSADVVDLMAALRASLAPRGTPPSAAAPRKSVKRAAATPKVATKKSRSAS